MTKSGATLVQVLKLAYSGELAAALAYGGHWRSVRNAEDRNRIREIELEEWKHRQLVGQMLEDLGQRPEPLRELRCYFVGHFLSALCRIAGFFPPMYAAGKLESRNIVEYETAARLAQMSGHSEYADCLLEMAEVEWEHEQYFRSRIFQHRYLRFVRLWRQPPPKDQIRANFNIAVPGRTRVTSRPRFRDC